MKKQTLIIVFIFLIINTFAVTSSNFYTQSDRYLLTYHIPAMRSIDKATYFVFPFITFHLDATNTIISYRNMNIFYEDHYITNKEKELLTKDDLKLFLSYKTPIIKIGYKNIGFDLSYFMGTNVTLLDKQLSKLVLYGNNKQNYVLHNGDGSLVYGFTKTKISYSYPNSLNLSFIPNMHTKYNFLNNSLDFIRNVPIYLGANINFYLPIVYGEVLKSEQRFGTNVQESYADYYLDVIYSDVTEGKYKRKLTAGLGLSMVANFNKGMLFFDLDDIFGGIKFDNLTEKVFEGVFQDSLTHFQSEYETVNNDTIIEGTKNRYKSLSANLTIGLEYNVYKDFYATLSYKHSKYIYPNGISLKARKIFLGFLPVAAKIGYDKVMNYELSTGIYLTNLEFYFHITTFGGFFNYAKGTGIGFNWLQRF
jgi:hypothetical protein